MNAINFNFIELFLVAKVYTMNFNVFPKKRFRTMIKFFIVFIVFNDIYGQNLGMYAYKPKEEAVKVFVKALKAKTPVKQAELLLESISIDSNFSFPYHVLGDLKVQERLVFEDKGAFYYYTKFIEKQTKFTCEINYGDNIDEQIKSIEFPNPMAQYFQNCYDSRTTSKTIRNITFIEFVQKKRMDAVSYALVWNDNVITTSNEKMLSTVVKEILVNAKSNGCAELSNESIERVCFGLGDYYLQKSIYQDALQPYQILEEYNNIFKYDSGKQFKKETIESLQNRIALAYALNGQKELAIQKLSNTMKLGDYNPSKKILKEAVQVLNIISEIQSGEICKNKNGELVFCENKNIRIDNFSSIFQLKSAFTKIPLNAFDEVLSLNAGSSYNSLFSSYNQPIELMKWCSLGFELGVLWPKPQKISPNDISNLRQEMALFGGGEGEKIVPYFLKDYLLKSDCVGNNILDIRSTSVGFDIYVSSKRQASLTAIMSVPLDWRQFKNIPVKYYNANGELVSIDSLGNSLPSTANCPRAYDLYKAEYEAQLARQEAERIEQERIRQAQEQARIQQANESKLQLAIAEAEAKKATIQQEQKATQAQTKQAVEQGKVVNPFAFLDVFSGMFSSSSSSTPKKQVKCPACKGVNSQHQCSQCNGKGSYICDQYQCKGKGIDWDKRQCSKCAGRGTINCEKCRATGIENCSTCGGDGVAEE